MAAVASDNPLGLQTLQAPELGADSARFVGARAKSRRARVDALARCRRARPRSLLVTNTNRTGRGRTRDGRTPTRTPSATVQRCEAAAKTARGKGVDIVSPQMKLKAALQ